MADEPIKPDPPQNPTPGDTIPEVPLASLPPDVLQELADGERDRVEDELQKTMHPGERRYDPYHHLKKRPSRTDHLAGYKWKKGQSGNPNGRPKNARTMRTRLKQLIMTKANRLPIVKAILDGLNLDVETIDRLDVGDVVALCGVMDAMRGKAIQFSEVMRKLDGPIFNDTEEIMDAAVVKMPSVAKSPEVRKQESIDFYEAVIHHPDATLTDKMKARELLDKLLGLTNETVETNEQRAAALRALTSMMLQSVPESASK